MRNVKLMTQARFYKQGETLAAVALPHTWNAFDGQDGGNDYWRGIGTYEIDLPDPTKGKKQYIESRAQTMWPPFTATVGSWEPTRVASPPSVST